MKTINIFISMTFVSFLILALSTVCIASPPSMAPATDKQAAPTQEERAKSPTSKETEGLHKVSISRTIIKGCLTGPVVQKVLERVQRRVRWCYDQEFQNDSKLSGKITSAWTIGPKGDVLSAQIKESTLNNASNNYNVEECLLGIIEKLKFPPCAGGGSADVEYPWIFRSSQSPTLSKTTKDLSGIKDLRKKRSETVTAIVKRNEKDVLSCYQKQLKEEPQLSGKISAKVSLDKRGNVTKVLLDGIDSKALKGCIEQKITAWKFSASPQKLSFTTSFTFANGKSN